jgi:replicative DNA helicase
MPESEQSLADIFATRMDRAEQQDGGNWKGLCPKCSGTFWIMSTGYSCNGCSLKGTSLWDLDAIFDERDGIGTYAEPENDPFQYDGPKFDVVGEGLLDEIDRKKQEPVDAVATPFKAWNLSCRDEGGGEGIARGWHMVVAGNPGMGKSVLALNIAAAAVRAGERVALISLEMSQMQAVTRYMSIFTGVKIRGLEHGKGYSTDEAFQAKSIIMENEERTGGQFIVNRRQISKLSDIAGAMRWLHEIQGCRYFITDYLQLAWTGNATNLLDRVTEVSHTVRQMSTDLHVVSIGLSQFNRSTSAAKETPTVQGLMGGSPLENDAEQVLMLDHSRYVKTPGQKHFGCDALVPLVLGKNRHGPVGEFAVQWDYSTLRATETDMKRLQTALDAQT